LHKLSPDTDSRPTVKVHPVSRYMKLNSQREKHKNSYYDVILLSNRL